MTAISVEQLKSKLAPVVAQAGLDLDDLKLSKSGKYRVLEIVVDADHVDLDQVAIASRAVSEYLDEQNLMGEQQYTLEVATRGVDAPLVKPIHWQRNIGRLVKVSGDSINEIGRIKSFANPFVTLEIKNKDREIDINSISKAVVQVEFKKMAEEE